MQSLTRRPCATAHRSVPAWFAACVSDAREARRKEDPQSRRRDRRPSKIPPSLDRRSFLAGLSKRTEVFEELGIGTEHQRRALAGQAFHIGLHGTVERVE